MIYQTGSFEGHRISNIFSHTIPNYPRPNGSPKPIHSVFSDPREKILPLLDEAASVSKNQWIPARDANGILIPFGYEIPMGKVVGTAGETKIFILFNNQTASVVETAHPIL